MRAFLATMPLLLASCVTSADLAKVNEAVYDAQEALELVEATLDDEEATNEEIAAAASQARAEALAAAEAVVAVAEDVEERTKGFIDGLGDASEGGLFAILAAAGVHLYRNSTRKKDLAQVKDSA